MRGALDARRLSSVEVVEALLRRAADLDAPTSPTALRSVLAYSERALDEARASDSHRRTAGSAPRPLEGIPVLVKDNIEAVGLPATAGATSLVGRPPVADAPLVRRLRQAGAVILGATNLTEWANIRSTRSTGGWSAVGGLTANPWALDRNPGGSSSGSGAALAAGLAPLAVGTETDGSITCPASLNGVAGLKPAVGAVPTGGVVPISASQDSPGPMARTAADVALLYRVLAAGHRAPGSPTPDPSYPWDGPDGQDGPDRLDGLGVLVTGDVRVGVARTWYTGHPATDELFEEAVGRLRGSGWQVVDVAPPVPDASVEDDEMTVLLCELLTGLDAYLPTRGPGGPQSLAEVVAHERGHSGEELAWFGHDLFERALDLGGVGRDRYRQARARNLEWARDRCLEPALSGIDVLVAPTYGPAWKSDLVLGGHPALAAPTTTAPAIAGWPIATVPMGLAAGLPVGLGLIARPGRELLLLAVGASVERPDRPTWRPPGRG
ncbi:MAG: amidase [Acidobacteriota bacterium]|nr:amidase [Acidobacteriota bacterium]